MRRLSAVTDNALAIKKFERAVGPARAVGPGLPFPKGDAGQILSYASSDLLNSVDE